MTYHNADECFLVMRLIEKLMTRLAETGNQLILTPDDGKWFALMAAEKAEAATPLSALIALAKHK